MKIVRPLFFLVLMCFGFGVPHLSGQNQLERISVAERSDGQGFVIRFHLDEMVDSFHVSQPELNRVEVRLFSADLSLNNPLLPTDTRPVEDIGLQIFPDGLGTSFLLNPEIFFIADIYPDQNQRHLLLSLEYAEESEVREIVNASKDIFENVTDREDEAAVREDQTVSEEVPPGETDSVTDTPSERIPEKERSRSSMSQRISPGDPFELYLRFIPEVHARDSQPSWSLRPMNTDMEETAATLPDAHPWMNHPVFKQSTLDTGVDGLAFYSPKVFISHNDEIPWGKNDGSLWQGVGLNYSISTGARYKNGPVTAVFKPEYSYSENKEYYLSRIPIHAGLDSLAMPLTYADIPMRFGAESFTNFNLGDSFIQVDYNGFAAGISNERLWTGPAVYNPLIFSNNAPGFLHGYIGTAEPYETGYGTIEGKWLWGGLKESGYFDADSTNNLRYVTALTLNYSPDFLPGLNFGINRASYSYFGDDGFGASDLFLVFKRLPSKYDVEDDVSPNDVHYTMTSFFASFDLPKQGFEVYFEFGRNDFRRPLRDFLSQPDLNRGYVLGFMKRFNLTPGKRLLFNMEFTNLENSTVTQQFRDFNIWYTNEKIQQGFTNKGQVIGAGIGPGSSIQKFKLSYYDTWGMVGASLARVAHNMDRHFKYKDFFLSKDYVGFEGALLTSRHEIEFRYRLTALVFLPYNFELQAEYSIGKIENRYNFRLYDLTNRNIAFTLRYNLPGFLR